VHKQILEQARSHERHIAGFLRDLIAIKSVSSREEAVVGRIEQEMRASGYDEVRIDPMGNILGRVGSGPRVLALDAGAPAT
jgi:putative aminopeptidase FrvX